MNKRLSELLKEEFLTEDELNEIYSMENVIVKYNGCSKTLINYYCFTVYTNDGEEYNIYVI